MIEEQCSKEALINDMQKLQPRAVKLENSPERDRVFERSLNILGNMPYPFCAVDYKFQCTYLNSAASDLFSRAREDALGSYLGDIFPEFIDIYAQSLASSTDSKSPTHVEFRYAGNNRWYEINLYAAEKGYYLFFYDITRLKQTEEFLLQTKEQIFKVFHSSPIMMAIIRMTDNLFIEVNQKFLDIVDWERDDIIGHTALELNLWTDQQRIWLLDKVKEQGRVHNVDFDIRTRTGKLINTIASWELIMFNGVSCRLVVIQDISEKRQLEDTISRLDRLNLIGEMAASIGHEIRNPLTAIRGFLQMLRGNERYQDDKMYFELMIEELDRANSIISEYLRLAKDKVTDLKPRQLDNIVKTLYPIIQADANYAEIDVKLVLGEPPVHLFDEKEIRQLLLNLVRNGLEAMSPGGTLTIGTCFEGDDVVLYVLDQGHGLDTDLFDKLGTPFFTTKENGTGLGLAVCHSIALRHNAKIEFDTSADGTVFRVRFKKGLEQGALF